MPSAGHSPATQGSGNQGGGNQGGGNGVGPTPAQHSGASATPLGLSAALVAVFAWGLGNTIIAAVPMTGMAIAFYRLGFASVLYTVILYGRGGRLSSRSFRFGWEGGIAFGADIAAFFVAIHLTSVANATTISALQPLVIIGFAAVMFGERIRARHILCSVVATAGVALVAFGAAQSGSGFGLGDLMAVLALFAWAWYFIASKKARRHLDTFEYMTVMNLVAFIFVIPITLITQDLFRTENRLGWTTSLAILAIVLIPGSGHILMNWAHAHTTLVLTSLITLAMPVISAVSAAVFLDQSVSAVQVFGIALVLAALAFVIVLDSKTAADATEPAP
jgi:drug/metabolite transporter (DMT)-like permease